jgi:hydroxyacylglutathione hydrolase
MEIKIQPMGATQTNCYIVTVEGKDFIIDPGMGATNWVVENVTNPVAILNTHCHFDHVWSNQAVQDALKVPIYAPKGDVFMLQNCPLGQSTPPSKADYEVDEDETLNIQGVQIQFLHFPGHTPGCSVIQIGDVWFSGDFLFEQSIGRWDFPYSSGEDMLKSLEKVAKVEENFTIYPGHGLTTTLKEEQKINHFWADQVRRTI